MKISVQMYSVREALATDFQAAVQRLVNLGFEVAEPFRLDEFRDDLVRARERFDINCPSAHQYFLVDGDFDDVLEADKADGVTYLIYLFWEHTDWQDPVRLEELAARLNDRGEQSAGAGTRACYLILPFVLAAPQVDRSALELFAEHLDPRVTLAMDTYWAVVRGVAITTMLSGQADRVK